MLKPSEPDRLDVAIRAIFFLLTWVAIIVTPASYQCWPVGVNP